MSLITKVMLSGLTCIACEKVVSKRLQTITEVERVVVSAQDGQALISASRPISEDEVTLALADTHYKVVHN